MTYNIDTVRALSEKLSNWGRWGPDDQLGTLNYISDEAIQRAAALVRRGRTFSLALPFDEHGPQNGLYRRFNPIHLMSRDGNDALAGTFAQDFHGGRELYMRSTDDIIIMPLQCGTQWDALSHIVFEGKIYNGYDARQVTSKGAKLNDIAQARASLVGRGVLLDVAHCQGRDWLDPGQVIEAADLDACLEAQKVDVLPGDIVLVRTGQLGAVRARREWGDYVGGAAPGLGLSTAEWLCSRKVAAVAADNFGVDVVPNQTPDVLMPLHIILLVYAGMMLGEFFDFEELSKDCASDGVYEFFFSAAPLPFTGAVGSPVNPIVVK